MHHGGPGPGPGGPGGPGWGPGGPRGPGGPWGPGGHGGPGWGPGPGGFFGGCADGICGMISSLFYCLCCCWLVQDCFGGPRPSYGPPPF
ncbi:putative polyketide hydroxylase [Ricinus communis]|uniref:Uncharacterized protein n=1 Tax=Ricinus communis TaxID=3988 RepID=B9S3W5_RICCO|nr:putative polyketide hydroxylase [Ricinus communis]EEF41646.1 conserved hypothetical protein [Ricinus communis]|eukprot:XP_002520684.1 uncharacterized protein LOC8287182 [Ricinus communis]